MNALLAIVFVVSTQSAAQPVPAADEEQKIEMKTYRFEMLAVASSVAPLVGKIEGGTRTLGISRIGGRDGIYVHHMQVCDVKMEGELDFVKTIAPPAFVKALKPPIGKVVFKGDDVTIDLREEFIGFDPKSKKLWPPKNRKGAGIIDTDKDGLPGATLEITVNDYGLIKLMVTQRAHSILHGKLQKDGSIKGRVDMKVLEQVMLGTKPGLFDIDQPFTVDESKSWFTMVPIANDANCLTR